MALTDPQAATLAAFADALAAKGYDTPEKVAAFVDYAAGVLDRMQKSYAVDAAKAQAQLLRQQANQMEQDAIAALAAADAALTPDEQQA